MGIDLKRGGRVPNHNERPAQSANQSRLAYQLYQFLSRRVPSNFNKTILKRLNQTRVTRFPISLSRIVKNLTDRNADKIFVIVGTVTNDLRLLTVPKLRICALKFTQEARRRVIKAGGKCLTFDQLAQVSPKGQKSVLLRGPRVRQEKRHFGLAPGQKGSHTAPHVRSKGRKFENARGR